MFSLDDTIVAIASAPGGAARGIVRLSGPGAIDCLDGLLSIRGQSDAALKQKAATSVVAGELRLTGLASSLPCEFYLWPARHGAARSYTGQAVVEIHTLGSPPLLELIQRTLCQRGARLAEPGEFTMRAFLAGRIDLTQAEAVLGVIDAVDREDLTVALGQLAGGLGRPLHQLRDALINLLAHVEAGFDFADEQLPFITAQELVRQLTEIQTQIEMICQQMVARDERSHIVTAVLVGRPNTGKSSLFNALSADRAAIISDRPGTTRDYLTTELELSGMKIRLVDTAGFGEEIGGQGASREIDRASQAITVEQRRAAEVVVVCLDCSRSMDPWERAFLQEMAARRPVVVGTKCDQPTKLDFFEGVVRTSALTGEGLEALKAELRARCLANAKQGAIVAGTATRCRESIRLAGQSVARARDLALAGQEELVAAELRVALDELGKVVGAVYTDDVLDCIFSRFCVGK